MRLWGGCFFENTGHRKQERSAVVSETMKLETIIEKKWIIIEKNVHKVRNCKWNYELEIKMCTKSETSTENDEVRTLTSSMGTPINSSKYAIFKLIFWAQRKHCGCETYLIW